MTVTSVACTGETSTAGGTVTVPGNGMWADSSIRGDVTAESEMRLQDDFAAAANKDYLLELAASTDEDVATGSFKIMQWEVNNQCMELFDDASINSKHAVEFREFSDLARDYDLRNSQGIEPLKPYLEAITSIDELISFEKDLQMIRSE